MLKLSRYNYYFQTNRNQIGIFNLITRAVEIYPIEFIAFSKNGPKISVNLAETENDYPPSMYSSGVILDSEIDEMIFIKNLYNVKVLLHNPAIMSHTGFIISLYRSRIHHTRRTL